MALSNEQLARHMGLASAIDYAKTRSGRRTLASSDIQRLALRFSTLILTGEVVGPPERDPAAEPQVVGEDDRDGDHAAAQW